MNTYGGMDVQMHIFLISALAGGGWRRVVSFMPSSFTPKERAPGTHWIGGWVGPRTSLDDVEGRKILPLQGLNSNPLALLLIASCYTDCATLDQKKYV
jgi:hypothetical protein